MAAYSSHGILQFGACVDRGNVKVSAPQRNIFCRIWPDDAIISIELSDLSRTFQIRFDDVHRLLAPPERNFMALVVERFPRVFAAGDARFRKPILPDADLWSRERTMILHLDTDGWFDQLCLLLPSEDLDSHVRVALSLSPTRLPQDFEKQYLIEVVRCMSGFRLTQEGIDKLASMPIDRLLLETAAIVNYCEIDPLTNLVPLCETIGNSGNEFTSLTTPSAHHQLVRNCVVNIFEILPKMPYLVQSSSLLDMCVDFGVVEHLMIVTFSEISGDRISNQVRKRVEDAFQNGLIVAGRKFSFLAASSDQLRHGSSWFLCESNPTEITVQSLRSRVGDFSMIVNPVKFLSRLGLSLSTSRRICDISGAIEIVDDIVHDGQNFTEGCGEMSHELAMSIATEFGLSFVPSAVQIRLGAFKGVLVRNASLQGVVARIRKSMIKFRSDDTMLRVVSVAQAGPLSLNHEVLTLLGPHVPHSTWETLLHEELLSLATPLYTSASSELPQYLLERYLNTLAPVISRTTLSHLQLNFWNDPLCLSVMRGVYLGSIMDLCERMHIPVRDGVMLMGVADPFGKLGPGEIAFKWKDACYEGAVLVYRNPLNHPGDVRKLMAVNRPELADLDGVLVFSVHAEEKGALPQFAKCSGGDLDGDHYAVLFGIEPSEQLRTNDIGSATDVLGSPLDMQSARIDEYIEYGASCGNSNESEAFLQIALNDVLGHVSNAHKAMADQSNDGAYDERCLQLAAMARLAVDAPKTGDVVNVPKDFKSDQYPDWMLNHTKPAYASNKVLGKLFRVVKDLQYVSVLQHAKCFEEYQRTSYIAKCVDSDAKLSSWIADIYLQYVAKVRVALAGWGLRSEVEMLVGPLKKKLTRYDFHKHRKRVVKTQAVIEQLCEEFANVFDEVLQTSSSNLARVVQAWWSADIEGFSAFRWVPWRRHAAAIAEVITVQELHKIVSAPLARLGAGIVDGYGEPRSINCADVVRQTVESFLKKIVKELLSIYIEEGVSEIVTRCIDALCEGFAFVIEENEHSDPESIIFNEACGRTLVSAIAQLPRLARSRSNIVKLALANTLGGSVDMVCVQLQRMLQCHAHRLAIWLDRKSLEQPLQLHQQLYSLSLKQQQMLIVTKVFVRDLRARTGAQINVQTIERSFRKEPVRSLLVSGTLTQLFKVENELHRLEITPSVRTLKFDEVVASVRFVTPVSSCGLVTLSDIVHPINPIHARKKMIASQIALDGIGSDFLGGPSFSDLILKHKLAEDFETLELSVKMGSFYVLGAPSQLLGAAPSRRLTARELVDLLIGNRHKPVDVEITSGGKGRKGRGGKGGRPFIIHFLRSGFNGSLSASPVGFSPQATSLTVKFKDRISGCGLSLEFRGRCAEITALRRDERRTMMYTECALAPQTSFWRGDLRIVANASTLVGESDELYIRVVSNPPIYLPKDAGIDVDWYKELKVNTIDYELEIIRAHNIMGTPCDDIECSQFEIDHVVSCVPDGSGVEIESDQFEVSVHLEPMLGIDVEPSELAQSVHRAVGKIHREVGKITF